MSASSIGPVELRPLDEDHFTEYFDCERDDNALGNWLDRHAPRFSSEGLTKVWVLSTKRTPGDVLGYFTLSALSVMRTDVPRGEVDPQVAPGMNLPGMLLGKFAVSKEYHGRGVADALMVHVYAAYCATAALTGTKMLVVQPGNEALLNLYVDRFGFRPLRQRGDRDGIEDLFMVTGDAAAQLAEGRGRLVDAGLFDDSRLRVGGW